MFQHQTMSPKLVGTDNDTVGIKKSKKTLSVSPNNKKQDRKVATVSKSKKKNSTSNDATIAAPVAVKKVRKRKTNASDEEILKVKKTKLNKKEKLENSDVSVQTNLVPQASPNKSKGKKKSENKTNKTNKTDKLSDSTELPVPARSNNLQKTKTKRSKDDANTINDNPFCNANITDEKNVFSPNKLDESLSLIEHQQQEEHQQNVQQYATTSNQTRENCNSLVYG